MTLIMIWPNKAEGPTGLHIASDGLYSGPDGRWNHGPKLFRLFGTHSYLACCGSSTLALSAILQSTAILSNTDLLAGDGGQPITVSARCNAITTLFNDSVKTFPKTWGGNGEAKLLFCGFDGLRNRFMLHEIALGRKGASTKSVTLSKNAVRCYGSGAERARALLSEGMATVEILKVLKTVIDDEAVKDVGGVPQMVTIWTRRSQAVGFNWHINGSIQSTLFGLPLHFHSRMKKVRFLDETFKPAKYLGVQRMIRSNCSPG